MQNDQLAWATKQSNAPHILKESKSCSPNTINTPHKLRSSSYFHHVFFKNNDIVKIYLNQKKKIWRISLSATKLFQLLTIAIFWLALGLNIKVCIHRSVIRTNNVIIATIFNHLHPHRIFQNFIQYPISPWRRPHFSRRIVLFRSHIELERWRELYLTFIKPLQNRPSLALPQKLVVIQHDVIQAFAHKMVNHVPLPHNPVIQVPHHHR